MSFTLQSRRAFVAALVLLVLILWAPLAAARCNVETESALGWYWQDWEPSWCPDVVDSFLRALDKWYWPAEDVLELSIEREWALSDDPSLTISLLEADLPDRRIAVLDTHGGLTPGENDAVIAVEYYSTIQGREDAFAYYKTHRGYVDPDEILKGTHPYYDGYMILLTGLGIQKNLGNVVRDDAIVYGAYCQSWYHRDDWVGAGAGDDYPSYMGYDHEPDVPDVCADHRALWCTLRCGLWPEVQATTSSAVYVANQVPYGELMLYGDRTNVMSCKEDCHNSVVTFEKYGAFDSKVWWRSISETGSERFTVRGYSSPESEPDTLAAVPAVGGRGVVQHYAVDVMPDFRYFDVVESDRWEQEASSSLFSRTDRPKKWDAWMLHPRLTLDEEESGLGSGPTGKEEDLDSSDSESKAPARIVASNGPSMKTGLQVADVVIYTSDSGWFWQPVASQVGAEGLHWVAWNGSGEAEAARFAYETTLLNNIAHEESCAAHPGSCTRHYPVNPGPLLIIVADANGPVLVRHSHFPDDGGRCAEGDCDSDFDITDVDLDGVPEGPVTRIPASTLEEVETACIAAEEFNTAINVHPDHLSLLSGDRYGSLPSDLLAEVEQSYGYDGFVSHPMLVRSDYSTDAERQAAGAQQINQGVLEIWGFGFSTYTNHWPGMFITDANVPDLTRRQRVVAWVPSCYTAGVDQADPIAAEMLMFNSTDETLAAAIVGHINGGWASQYEEFARILLSHRENAAPGTPVARIVYDAVIEAQQDDPWLFDFARSVGVLGSYVKIPESLCPGPNTECDVLVPDGGEEWERGSTHTIEWRVCFKGDESQRIEKHSIHLTRDLGSTWHVIDEDVSASARTYEWQVFALPSDNCKIKVVCHVEEYDDGIGGWIPAFQCICVSDVKFRIFPTGQPCPHLYAVRDGGLVRVNSVLSREDETKQVRRDRIIVPSCDADESGVVQLLIKQVDPDTTYLSGASLSLVRSAEKLAVACDGAVFRFGDLLEPEEASGDVGDALAVLAETDDRVFAGEEGATLDVALPSSGVTSGLVMVVASLKDPPDQPLSGARTPMSGIEVAILDDGGWFVLAGDTTRNVFIHPRQFKATVAVPVILRESGTEIVKMRANWHSEHPLDFIGFAPNAERVELDAQPLKPTWVEFSGVGDSYRAEWEESQVYRLVPGDEILIGFEPVADIAGQSVDCLVSLDGFYVGPGSLARVPHEQTLSMWVTSALPCVDGKLAGKFSVPVAATIRLNVYDVQGRLVRQVVRGSAEPGVHSFSWDLTNRAGRKVSPGLYFMRFEAPGKTVNTKVMIEK